MFRFVRSTQLDPSAHAVPFFFFKPAHLPSRGVRGESDGSAAYISMHFMPLCGPVVNAAGKFKIRGPTDLNPAITEIGAKRKVKSPTLKCTGATGPNL